jgi:hypothetical protein
MWWMGTRVDQLAYPDGTRARVRRLLPLASGFRPKHVTLGTFTMIQAMGESRTQWEAKPCGATGIWEAIFTDEALRGPPSFTRSEGARYLFANEVRIDGAAGLTLIFVHEADYPRHVGKGQARADAKKRKAEDGEAWLADKQRKIEDGARKRVERKDAAEKVWVDVGGCECSRKPHSWGV